jgi:hypothetical protein
MMHNIFFIVVVVAIIISGNNTRTTLNRFPTKTAILGTSHHKESATS